MQQNGELSVEEILESIKKVIARDNKETAQVERYRRETEGVVLRGPGSTFGLTPMSETGNDDDLGDEDEEVLDLSEEFGDEDGAEPAAAADATPQDMAADSAMELIEPLIIEDEIAPEPAPLPEPPLAIQTPAKEVAAPVARHSLEALTTMSDMPAVTETPAQSGETPLERMVRESLQPILREWLDANLEPMVERMVKVELERVMGKLT